MSTETHICPSCHARSYIYMHTLSPGIVKALIKFKYAVWLKGENSVHTRRDMDGKVYHDQQTRQSYQLELTKGEYANWTMLRYHGLVAKDRVGGKGYWLLTARGNQFLNGLRAVPLHVRVLNNEVLHDEDDNMPLVTYRQVMNSEPLFRDIGSIQRHPVPIDLAQGRLAL